MREVAQRSLSARGSLSCCEHGCVDTSECNWLCWQRVGALVVTVWSWRWLMATAKVVDVIDFAKTSFGSLACPAADRGRCSRISLLAEHQQSRT